ncbi:MULTISPECIES: hypothetical protein [Cyanophyceae]|uniref:hypothetical protein n=1 Tax=Cyanophyceae TaxID=3028117 RepID=UPI00168A0138|nr:hypothetical protein [Trichocoleus sp. FACHB-69]MBD1930442.1 hypothetical protein [Trichocoleus sp. FACHB-69]
MLRQSLSERLLIARRNWFWREFGWSEGSGDPFVGAYSDRALEETTVFRADNRVITVTGDRFANGCFANVCFTGMSDIKLDQLVDPLRPVSLLETLKTERVGVQERKRKKPR